MSNAEEIFGRWKAGGLEYLRRSVEERASEGAFIEFKRLTGDGPDLSRDDKQNLAKAVGGFANAGGGVLVWGVVTERDAEDSMRASGLRAIDGLSVFTDRVKALVETLLVPSVHGIQYELVAENSDQDRGHLLMLIPAVDGPPVLSKGPKQTTFYLRNEIGTAPMEHWQIADRFLRRPQPSLVVQAQVTPNGRREGFWGRFGYVRITIEIVNRGKGLALYPMLRVRPRFRMNEDRQWLDLTALPERPEVPIDPADHWVARVFASESGHPIHPFTSLQVCSIDCSLHESFVPDRLELDVSAHCDGAAFEATLVVESERLRHVRDVALGGA